MDPKEKSRHNRRVEKKANVVCTRDEKGRRNGRQDGREEQASKDNTKRWNRDGGSRKQGFDRGVGGCVLAPVKRVRAFWCG